jgi:hypothetical protein
VAAPGPETAAKMEAYASKRGLQHFENWSMPQPTQLLQHGFMETVPNVVIGDLPGGIDDAWLGHFDWKSIGHTKIKDHYFTVLVARAQASVSWAQRVLCHDRDLPELDASNPAEGLEPLKMEDAKVKIESDAFLERYAIWIDHDQDALEAWQLFDPALISWLTDEAPKDFSFELQDGALACFVPGVVDDADALDGLCAASARVLKRISEIAGGDGKVDVPAAGGPSRDEEVERKLAEHPFEKPPASVGRAALHFGPVPLVSGSSWHLAQEAFFRAHMAKLGLKPMAPEEFRAAHIQTAIPGQVTQIARGRLPGTQLDGYFIWTTEIDGSGLSWEIVLAEISDDDNSFAFTALPEVDPAEKDGFNVLGDQGSISVFKATGDPKGRDAKQLQEFIERACPLLEKAVAAAKQRP